MVSAVIGSNGLNSITGAVAGTPLKQTRPTLYEDWDSRSHQLYWYMYRSSRMFKVTLLSAAILLASAAYEGHDLDRDGKLSFREFRQLVRSNEKEKHTKKEVSALFVALDVDGSGFVNVQEFERFTTSLTRSAKFYQEYEVREGGAFGRWSKPAKKFVLTSDLFSTASTAPHMKQVLRDLLGKKNVTALWIHDARAGWDDTSVARGWLMDGFAELRHLEDCGVVASAGLWINRWKGLGGEYGMQLAEQLEPKFVQSYAEADVPRVKRLIDRTRLLYLPGGNPYSLLDALRRNPEGAAVWKHAARRIDEGKLVVLTRSAGTIVVGATIDVSPERPERWRGDVAGLGLARHLAFIPHFHLPHVNRLVHSERWRGSVDRAQWTKADFLRALQARERKTGIQGVPLREGWFVAHDGSRQADKRWIAYEGPASYRLPGWLSAVVQRLEKPYWDVMWYLADVLRKMEIKRAAEVSTWGQLGSVVIALVWLVGYVILLLVAASFVSGMLSRRVARGAAQVRSPPYIDREVVAPWLEASTPGLDLGELTLLALSVALIVGGAFLALPELIARFSADAASDSA